MIPAALWLVWPSCVSSEVPEDYVLLDPVERAVRVSMALRGVRPSPGELAEARDHPGRLGALVDRWLEDPRFTETVVDLYADLFDLRADLVDPLPPVGPLEGYDLGSLDRSLNEAPLQLVRSIVDEGRPLTDLVTADRTFADPAVATVYGLDHDPDGPTWQEVPWTDGRPTAGILAEPALWRRHESANANFNRGRANVVADTLLCADFASRDIAPGGTTSAEGVELSEVLATDPGCVACHQTLDPLAAHLWVISPLYRWDTVLKAYGRSCKDQLVESEFTGLEYNWNGLCYPLETYNPGHAQAWEDWNLPPPGFYGQPTGDLSDLGRAIADDPRFALCTARRVYGWLSRTDPHALPLEAADPLRVTLVESGFDLRALVREIVLSEPFGATAIRRGARPEVAPVGAIATRPEQLARLLEDVAGFTWTVDPDLPSCAEASPPTCWGPVDLLRSDRFGFRGMSGGADSVSVLLPIATPTPTRELVWRQAAAEAAARAVRSDLAERDPGRRRLLDRVERDTTDGGRIKAQIAAMAPRVFGRFLTESDGVVQGLAALWASDLARRGDPEAAWILVLTAMLNDPWVSFH